MPMEKTSKFKVVTAFLLVTFSLAQSESFSCQNEQLAVTKIINSLGLRLEKMIAKQGNYFFSPLSISVALAMIYVGARGNTRKQMSDALEYNIVGKNCLPNKISENFRELIRALRREGQDYSLYLANDAFLKTGYKVSHFYTYNLEKFFNSKVEFLNFEDTLDTMNQINKWVADNTRNKIPKLLNEPLDPLTVMVLVNAVYFKGLWDLPFSETETKNDLFYGLNSTTKSVPFMIMEDREHIYYDPVKKYSILELEYVGGNISMIIILPDNREEFPKYDLTSKSLCEIRTKLEYKPVRVVIPKFKMEFKRELSKDMIKLGMEELFSDRADLTGIRERSDLHVSVMVHKAVIEVNELGSEASAISGVGIDGRGKVTSREKFTANHPFLFYIVHNETNTILFSGRLIDP